MFLNSGLKIFDIIKMLLEEPKSRKEIAKILRNKGEKADYLTVTKYLRTLRALSFQIIYKNKKPYITKTPFSINLDENEARGFEVFKSIAKNIYPEKIGVKYKITEEKLKNFIKHKENNSPHFLQENSYFSFNSIENIEEISSFLDEDGFEFKIKYENNICFILFPKVKFTKNGAYLQGINKENKLKKIFKISKIEKIKPVLNNNPFRQEPFQETVFKIKGRLIKNYILKKGEKARYKENEIIVTNKLEPKEELFSRLLKYGEFCEIIYPKKDIEIFSKKVENLIKYYNSM